MSEHETNPQRYADPAEPTAEHRSVAPTGPPAPAAEGEPATVQQPAVPTDSAAHTPPAAPGAASAPPSPPGYQGNFGWSTGGNSAGAPGSGGAVPPPPHGGPPPHAPGEPPHAPGQPPNVPGQPPVWAQPAPRPNHNRFGKIVATGAAALVLAIGSGLLGGYVGTQLDNNTTATTTASGTSAPAPVIDRSSLASIAAAVAPSVVSINTGNAEGSGVVLSADGSILTNNHVVATAQGGTMRVIFSDGKSANATVVGTDPKTDLAVVKASGVSNLSPAKLGNSDSVQIGDTVLAVGNPLGLQGSVTSGIISAKNRTIQAASENGQGGGTSMSGLLQTDAPINPGNSGGALVNTEGQVIGINTAIATAGQSNGNIGVGFAIPSNKAKQVADQLEAGKKVSHPFLGVAVGDAQNGGAIVTRVQSGSPADKAGLQQGDVITKFGDKAINTADDLVNAVQSGNTGDQATVTFTRSGSQQTTTVTLGEAS
jgi:putative serine protease PepD